MADGWGSICKLIAIGIAITLLLAIITWLAIFHPYSIRPRVDAAALATFDVNTTAIGGTDLWYDLSLDVTFFNDHRLMSVTFDRVAAWLYFHGSKLGPSDSSAAWLPKFKLRPRRHQKLHPVLFGGARNVSGAVADAARESHGLDVIVRLNSRLFYHSFFLPPGLYRYRYDCLLHFSKPTNGTPALMLNAPGVKCSKKHLHKAEILV